MLVKLLDYNSKSKTAVIEVQEIESDEIINFLVKFQKMGRMKNKTETRGKSTRQNTLEAPDLSNIENSPSSQSNQDNQKNTPTTSDTDDEDAIESALRKSLKILRDEDEDE